MAQLDPGTVFAGLTIEEVIGRGSMGIVYRARDPKLERVVALKVIAEHLAADDEFRTRFATEARLAATVEHPGIVSIYATGEEEGIPYLAMRLVNGESLASLIATRGKISPRETLALLQPIAGALDSAARAGVLHRDVKPANILVPADGSGAVLIDFGIGRALDSSRSTHTGGWLGTVDYLAPERVQGNEIGASSDQYALACVFYEAVTGRPPYQKDDIVKTLFAHANDPIPSVQTLESGLDQSINGALAIGLAKSPEARFGTCAALFTALATTIENPQPDVAMAGAAAGATIGSTAAFPAAENGASASPPSEPPSAPAEPASISSGDASSTRTGGISTGVIAAIAVGAIAIVIAIIVGITLLGSDSGSNSTGVAATAAATTEAATTNDASATTAAKVPTRRETIELATYLIPPNPPYRCIGPGLMDHPGNADFFPQFSDGQQILYSTRPGYQKDYILCGGSTTYSRPGYSSATLGIGAPDVTERVVAVTGLFGRDFDGGIGRGGSMTLTVLYGNKPICKFSTDGDGHARRFVCKGFPEQSDLSSVRLRMKVENDSQYGQFAGIGSPKATVEVEK